MHDPLVNPDPAYTRSQARLYGCVDRGVNDVPYREQAYSWEMVVEVFSCLRERKETCVMAQAVAQLAALGTTEERCQSCKRAFNRGEQMTAVQDSEGDPLGWVCQPCIDEWKANGEDSATAKALFGAEDQP